MSMSTSKDDAALLLFNLKKFLVEEMGATVKMSTDETPIGAQRWASVRVFSAGEARRSLHRRRGAELKKRRRACTL